MVQQFDERLERYPGKAAHDATGVGDVVDDYIEGVAGVTCRACFLEGKRGPDAALFETDEIDPRSKTCRYVWGSSGFDRARRSRLLKHLRAEHPEFLPVWFPEVAAVVTK
jgi:hypothetical protein